MWTQFRTILLAAISILAFGDLRAADSPDAKVLVSPDAPFAERLAAKEIRRYLYATTGELLPIATADKLSGPAVAVASKEAALAKVDDAGLQKSIDSLGPQQYVLKTIRSGGQPVVLVIGGDPLGALYGAYRLCEHLGVRFYLHGDVVPDEKSALRLPEVDERAAPLFELRGIQPFHDFPEGPDWWDADQYKAILGQLPKMRMNFFGLHTYPEGGVGPEPAVWIGSAGDIGPGETVKFSYPSRHFATSNAHFPQHKAAWGYESMKTGDYVLGAAQFFPRDDFGPDAMTGLGPWTEMSTVQSNELFARMGRTLDDVFSTARKLGVKTCLGTETPLVVPTPVKERLKASGKDPADPKVIEELYEGMFRRIAQTHPLDYYWFWTPENWTWQGCTQQQIDATLADLRAAIAAARNAGNPFTLATCGWVLGPPQEPALFDNLLPKEMPMSCISRQVGHAPVEPGFANVKGRPKWAIPWLEDDPALISPQLWVGRMRQDAADARKYDCTGLMGIHWRTRILAPNVSALAKAAWDQSGWKASGPAEAAETTPAEGPVGGRIARFPGQEMQGTDEDPVYQAVRYGLRAYRLDLPNGIYQVTLKFCEPAYGEPRKRVFAVKVQGKLVADQLDIFQRVGKNKALDITAENVEVTGGRLAIDFIAQVEYPCIAAIVVEGPVSRKINCGGPAWQDYRADWPESQEAVGRERFLPCADFYADWARAEFGDAVAGPAAALFEKIDGKLPRPSDWVNGPGGIKPDSRPWSEVAKEYAFVDEMIALAPEVKGAGNAERFLYWLNHFRSMRANAEFNGALAQFNAAMAKVKEEKDPTKRGELARELALPIRREQIRLLGLIQGYLLSAVTTYGGLGNVANWQQHIIPMVITSPGKELAGALGEPLPADCVPASDLQGDGISENRLIVPTVRTMAVKGEAFCLKALVVGVEPKGVEVQWRRLGGDAFNKLKMDHVARAVFQARLPEEATQDDFEYRVIADRPSGPMSGGKSPYVVPPGNVFPPVGTQTVIVVDDPSRS